MASGLGFAGFAFTATVTAAPLAVGALPTTVSAWDDEPVTVERPDFVKALDANGIESTNGSGNGVLLTHTLHEAPEGNPLPSRR